MILLTNINYVYNQVEQNICGKTINKVITLTGYKVSFIINETIESEIEIKTYKEMMVEDIKQCIIDRLMMRSHG